MSRRLRAPRYDVPNTAPEPLRLVQGFVNTVDYERESDWLGDPVQLRRWLANQGLGDFAVGQADVEAALGFREALRELLAANNERRRASAPALEAVNRAAERGRLTIRLDEQGRPELAPLAGGAEGALGRVVAIVLEAIAAGAGWERLKACRECGWAFYDYSRNRSATWCSMTLCGNRRKTRTYRRRHAGAAR